MAAMFFGCSSLKEINIPNFNTNNVSSMAAMFSECPVELKKNIKAQNKNIKDKAF